MTPADDLRAAADPSVLFEQATGLAPLAWQIQYLRQVGNVAVLKGRQTGASTAAAIACIHLVLYHPDVNAIVISPSQRQSQEIAKKARAGLRRLNVQLVEDSASVLRLRNGSRIVSLPGSPRSARGWSGKLLILDECAYLEDATIVAARALVAATAGRTIAQSTPAGESGTFYDLIQADDPEWTRFTIRSDEVPTITRDFLDAERRAMAPDEFDREYMAIFGKSGGGLFSAATLAGLILEEETA